MRSRENLLPPLWVITLGLLAFIVWIGYQLKELIVLLVISYAAAYAIDPVLKWLERRNISRSAGVFVLAGGFSLAVFFLALTAIPTIVEEYTRLSVNFSDYVEIAKTKIETFFVWAKTKIPERYLEQDQATSLAEMAPTLSGYVSGDALKGALAGILGTILHGYSVTLAILNVFLLPFIVYYLAVDLPKLHASALALIPTTRRSKFKRLFTEIDLYVSAFVRGQIMVCSILFLLYAFGLGFIGVELWLLLAVISGFGNIIPFVGFLVGIVLTTIMTLVTFGDFSHLLMVWALYGVVQFLEGTFITPRIVGESVGLSPLVVILALFAGGQLFGLLGVLLAVPIAAALRVLANHTHSWVVGRV